MTYAQIKGGVVKNIVAVTDQSPMDKLAEGFDFFIRVCNLPPPKPGVDWKYDGQNFTPPDPIVIEEQT